MRRRNPEAGAAENDELERLCDQLGRVETPFDEITRSRAEARLGAALACEPARRQRARAWVAGVAALVALGAAAGGVLIVRNVGPAARAPVASRPEDAPRFEPYVVAPAGGTTAGEARAASVPEALVQPSSRLEVPAGWLVRASLGDAVSVTLAGPARAWSESAAQTGRTVIHLAEGRLLASLEGGGGRRLEIVSPGAITKVVGTLFSVEVVGGASRVAVAHGRVQVIAAPGSSNGPPPEPRQIAAGESWLTTLPEPDGLDPALAEALANHERTPPPRGLAVPLSVTESPAGTGVWVGKRRIATAPAWVLVEPRVTVRLSAPARPPASPPELTPPPSTEPSPPPEPAVRATRRATLAWATGPTAPRPLVTPPGAALTQPPALAPAPPAPDELTAQTLFRQADAARATGDTKLALRSLRMLVERFPHDRATAAARYELALMEQATRDGETALRDLAAVDSPSLEEPAEYLRCRVLVKRAPAEAERCLADFRRRFPSSAHDADALAAEAALALSRGGCPAADAARAELERRYPAHGSVVRLRAACPSVLDGRRTPALPESPPPPSAPPVAP